MKRWLKSKPFCIDSFIFQIRFLIFFSPLSGRQILGSDGDHGKRVFQLPPDSSGVLFEILQEDAGQQRIQQTRHLSQEHRLQHL